MFFIILNYKFNMTSNSQINGYKEHQFNMIQIQHDSTNLQMFCTVILNEYYFCLFTGLDTKKRQVISLFRPYFPSLKKRKFSALYLCDNNPQATFNLLLRPLSLPLFGGWWSGGGVGSGGVGEGRKLKGGLYHIQRHSDVYHAAQSSTEVVCFFLQSDFFFFFTAVVCFFLQSDFCCCLF